MTFASALRTLRLRAGLTQEELAEKAGLSVRGLSDLERGERKRPYRHTVDALAAALGLDGDSRDLLVRAAGGAASPLRFPALPIQRTSLVGREREVAAAVAFLSSSRSGLLTLTGPGGVGKTRLALEVATRSHSLAADGILFVDLSAVRQPEGVLPAIGLAAGLEQRGATGLLEALTALWSGRSVLLVLDNFEQVIEAAPDIALLLGRNAALRVLVTSRLALRVSDEQVFPVRPLAYPAESQAVHDLDLEAYPALALLAERASAAGHDFGPGERDLALMAEVCARLEGLPLAIELAAARVGLVGLAGLAERLREPLAILTTGNRDAPARQRSLRDTVAWSFELLPESARKLLRLLSVFEGGWTISAAESLAGHAVLDDMAALLDASLVHPVATPGPARLSLLISVRDFAREELVREGESFKAGVGHTDLYRRLAADCESEFKYRYEGWRDRYAPEVDNFRAAMRRAIDAGDHEQARLTIADLFWLFETLGLQRELLQWAQAALDCGPADRSIPRARALWAKGAGHWMFGKFHDARVCFEECLAISSSLDDQEGSARALRYLAIVDLSTGDPERAEQHFRESLAIHERHGGEWEIAFTSFLLGDAVAQSRPQDAAPLYRQSLTIFDSLANSMGSALALTGLGGIAMRRGDFESARRLFLQGLELRRAGRHTWTEAISLASLAELYARAGEPDEAQSYGREALDLFQRLGDEERVGWVSTVLATIPVDHGIHSRAPR